MKAQDTMTAEEQAAWVALAERADLYEKPTPIEHGTVHGYWRNCPCEDCHSAYNAYAAAQARGRRARKKAARL